MSAEQRRQGPKRREPTANSIAIGALLQDPARLRQVLPRMLFGDFPQLEEWGAPGMVKLPAAIIFHALPTDGKRARIATETMARALATVLTEDIYTPNGDIERGPLIFNALFLARLLAPSQHLLEPLERIPRDRLEPFFEETGFDHQDLLDGAIEKNRVPPSE